ncbi:MAG: hypothetical protein ACTTI3_06930 [Treponema sp.]
MTGEYKLVSHTKTIKITDATPITGQELDKHGIVLVGHRMGVVMDKPNETEMVVCFDTQRDFTTKSFTESDLPKVGEKLYIKTSDGKLTKEEGGNKLVGYYWGQIGGAAIFSLHA